MGKQVDYIEFYQQHIEGLKHTSGDEWKGHCPFSENHSGGIDKNPSFSVNCTTGAYQCFSCGATGYLDKFCKAKGIPIPGQQKKEWQEPEAVFSYHDEHGVLLYQACRFPGKKFRQRRPDSKGGWIYKTQGIKKNHTGYRNYARQTIANGYLFQREKSTLTTFGSWAL